MIPPVLPLNRRVPAHSVSSGVKPVDDATDAGIVVRAGTRDYPRTVPAYTIRTPSPGGQCNAQATGLPAFFLGSRQARNPVRAGGVNHLWKWEPKGLEPCQSKSFFSPLRPVPVLRPAVTPWANKPRAVRPSAPVPASSPATGCSKERPSVRQAMSLTASSTPDAVTSGYHGRTERASKHLRSQPCASGRAVFLRAGPGASRSLLRKPDHVR